MATSILEHIATSIGIPLSVAKHRVLSAPLRYKVYTIPKHHGGERTIAQPAKDVKFIQRIMIKDLLSKMPIHDCAFAYIKNKNILMNAKQHIGSKFLLKLDFSNFFPSIKPDDLLIKIKSNFQSKLTNEDEQAISCLFFWKPKNSIGLELSIGAPSSPIISNIVMHEFDKKLYQYCTNLNIRYTRYADDLCFSTNYNGVLDKIISYVEELLTAIEAPRLSINKDKTINISKKFRRTVTGLILTPTGNISIGREMKRKIRSKLNHYKNGTLPEEEILKLKGWLAFAYDVEPEFAKKMLSKFQ